MTVKINTPEWSYKLIGYDTFEGKHYQMSTYKTEAEALHAAKDVLQRLEKNQPSARSGGRGLLGIQDRVFVQGPDGKMTKVAPE